MLRQNRRAGRARLALSLVALHLVLARHARAQDDTATPAPTATATPTPSPTATTTPTPPTTTTTPTDTPPSADDDGSGGSETPVPPTTAPPESLSPAPQSGQTHLRAQFRVSGSGASPSALTDDEGAKSAFLDALASGSSDPRLPRASLSVLRVSPAFVPLPSDDNDNNSNNRRRRARKLLLLDRIGDTSDVLVDVDASQLDQGTPQRNVQAAYRSVRNAAYSGLISSHLRSTRSKRWAVVLTHAAASSPGQLPLLPAPDDSCENRLGPSSCLDGTGLTPAAAKGIIAAGVIVALFALAFVGVAWDRRARAAGSGGGSGAGGGWTGKTGTMADLAGSPRAAAAAAGLADIPAPPRPPLPTAATTATTTTSSSQAGGGEKIKAER